jgi:hypothetical protein
MEKVVWGKRNTKRKRTGRIGRFENGTCQGALGSIYLLILYSLESRDRGLRKGYGSDAVIIKKLGRNTAFLWCKASGRKISRFSYQMHRKRDNGMISVA